MLNRRRMKDLKKDLGIIDSGMYAGLVSKERFVDSLKYVDKHGAKALITNYAEQIDSIDKKIASKELDYWKFNPELEVLMSYYRMFLRSISEVEKYHKLPPFITLPVLNQQPNKE